MFGRLGSDFDRLGAPSKAGTGAGPVINYFLLLADTTSKLLLVNGSDRLVLAGTPF